jgi:hypothetical protein
MGSPARARFHDDSYRKVGRIIAEWLWAAGRLTRSISISPPAWREKECDRPGSESAQQSTAAFADFIRHSARVGG